MDLRTLLQTIYRTPASTGVIGTGGTYGALLNAVTDPLDNSYTTDSGSGLAAYGDLSTTQQVALNWLRSDTAAAYATLSRGGATSRAGASAKGGLLHLLQIGAEVASAPGAAGDVFVTGGCSATAVQAMTGATLLTFADSNTITVTGDGNDVFSFGCCDAITVSGAGNTVYGGPGAASFRISGHVNTFRGGEGCDTVTLAGPDAAANIVVGGVGHLVVNSTAPVTQFIGGPGDAVMTLSGGDYSSILLGSGDFTGHISGNGISIETGSGRATLDVASTGGGVIVTGSGCATVCFTGNGETLMEGDASGHAVFSVSGRGNSIFGGDVVTATGSGLEVRSRADGLTGTMSGQIAGVLNNMGSFGSDPVIASAIAAADPFFAPQNLPAPTPAATAAACQPAPGCCSSGTSVRFINLNATQSAVYADTRYDVVTVNGSGNNLYGGAAGRTVTIASGSNNLIWGSAGCNTYIGDGQANVLEYIALPGAAASPGPVVVNLAAGLALNSYGGLDRICGINWVEAGSGSTLVGGAAAATLTILGDNGSIRDGCGNDTLYASGSGNRLQSTVGSDLLHTGGQNNTYLIGSATSAPLSTEIQQDWVGVTGTMQFVTPVSPKQLWFNSDAAGDLVVHVLGSREVVTVDNWFGASAHQLSCISAGGGTIDNAGINALVAAMATFQSAHAGFDPALAAKLPGDTALGSAFAAAWH